MIETIGWIGSLFLAFCGVPEAYIAIKKLHCSLSNEFLFMWFTGEIFMIIYAYLKNKQTKL